jgi:hypothetical protein
VEFWNNSQLISFSFFIKLKCFLVLKSKLIYFIFFRTRFCSRSKQGSLLACNFLRKPENEKITKKILFSKMISTNIKINLLSNLEYKIKLITLSGSLKRWMKKKWLKHYDWETFMWTSNSEWASQIILSSIHFNWSYLINNE